MQETEANNETVTADKLMQDFKLVVRDAENLIKATAEDIGGKLSEHAKDARSRLMASLESAKETCHTLEDKALVGARATDKVIREHPYQSVGVAFGVGMLLGVLVMRR